MRKFFIAACVLTLFGAMTVNAQTNGDDKGKKGKKEKELTDKQKKDIADALMEAGSYYNATDMYLEVFANDESNGYLAHQIALSYFLSRDYENAEEWYKKAWDINPGQFPFDHYYYALCMKMAGKYEESKAEFKKFISIKIWQYLIKVQRWFFNYSFRKKILIIKEQ